MLQPHTLAPARGARHRSKQVGRGNASGHGTYATRGGKGQTARSGGTRGLWRKSFRHIMQATPKQRGFTSLARPTTVVRLGDIERAAVAGDVIDLAWLKQHHLWASGNRRLKIIISGKLTKAVTVKGIAVSAGARAAIVAAGGAVN